MNKTMLGTAKEQNTLLKEMQALGYNVVECPDCGVALLVRCTNVRASDLPVDDDTYKCFLCDTEFDASDCSDLVFPDKHNDYQFANT